MNAIPPWVWLATAAALPVGILVGLGILAIGACIGGTKISREHARPCADEQYGPEDEARDPGELLYAPPPGVPGCGDRRPL